MRLPELIRRWLVEAFVNNPDRGEPDFVIGPPEDPYLRRWWVIPRNQWFNIYLHEIRHSDEPRAKHDHPWWNLSILLTGEYLELRPEGDVWRCQGEIILRRPEQAHRLVLPGAKEHRQVWTLFITGPVIREWGFICPQGWRHWKEFTSPLNKGETGRGCD